MGENYKIALKNKMDEFVNEIFDATALFPREEIYITTSQIKRAALSIVLNYIEGYARFKKKNQLNFFEISYGSLKETMYLLHFAYRRNFLPEQQFMKINGHVDEIGAMLWTEIVTLGRSLEKE